MLTFTKRPGPHADTAWAVVGQLAQLKLWLVCSRELMSCVGRLCKDYLYLYNSLPLIYLQSTQGRLLVALSHHNLPAAISHTTAADCRLSPQGSILRRNNMCANWPAVIAAQLPSHQPQHQHLCCKYPHSHLPAIMIWVKTVKHILIWSSFLHDQIKYKHTNNLIANVKQHTLKTRMITLQDNTGNIVAVQILRLKTRMYDNVQYSRLEAAAC